MKQIISILILLLFSNYILSQRNLTKDEILKNWNLPSDKSSKDSSVIVNSSLALNVQLTKLVDSLQANRIDSLIIFSTALPGYISSNKCDTGIIPITTFIIWNKDNITHIKKVRGNCTSEINKDSLVHLFNFYNKNTKKIESEFFMPVILGGQIYKDKTVSYTMTSIDHEPNYSFYYKIRGHGKSFHFCQSYIDNKESLFHDYNLNLSAYNWWLLIKQEIDNID